MDMSKPNHIYIVIERSLSLNVSLWVILAVPLNIFHKTDTEKDFSVAEQSLNKVSYM